MKLILNPNYDLYRKNEQAFCDSLQVAKTFGKEHKNIVRDIESLSCSEEFNRLNFERIKYRDSRGRYQSCNLSEAQKERRKRRYEESNVSAQSL